MNDMTAYEMLGGFINYFMYNATDFTKEDIAGALSKLSGEFNADMSWDELVEKAKKLGYEYDEDGFLSNDENSNAVEFTFDKWGNIATGSQIAVEGRTPAQLYQIMLALD